MAGARRTLGWVTVSVVLSALVWVMYMVFDRMATEGADSAADRYLLPILSISIVILALALVGLLIRNLVKLVIDRKRGVLGSRLRTKLVFFLLGFVLFPALMMVYGSGAIIKRTVEAIVRTPVEEITRNASEIVDEWNEYLRQHSARQAARLASTLGQGVFTDLPPQGRTGYLEAWLQEIGMDFALVEEEGRREVLGLGAGVELDGPGTAELKQGARTLAERGIAEAGPVSEIGFLGDDLLIHASAPFRIREQGGERTGVVTVGLIHSGAATDKMQRIKEHAGTYLLFRLDRREMIRLYLMLIGLTLLVTLFLATWIGFYLSKRITGPINEVAAAAREISAGNLGIRVEESTGDEVGVLVDAFNDMAAQLQESREVITRSTADLRTTNRALDERRRYIETLVANLSTAVISVDREAKVTTVNPAVETILGFPLKAGQSIRSSLSGAEFRPVLDMLAQVMDAGGDAGVVSRDLELVRSAGAMTIALRITALRGWQGEYLGVLIMMEDLTDLQRAQRAAAWREVARRIAHEIKNPLTPIQLSAQRLKKKFLAGSPDLGKILPEATDSIEREVAGLKHLVNEFSRFARMPEVVPQPVDVRELVDSVLALYKAVAGVEWVLEADPNLGIVALDPQQMRRALVNLLDNAVAAVDSRGRITVRIRRAEPGVLVLEVEDSGPGIPAEDRAKLFEPYFSTKPSGTGLGLAVVHRVVTEHRGTIQVHDGASGGARFVVEIPVQDEAGGEGVGMADEKILVIDDEPGVRTALEGILEDEGFRVESAGSGEEGLERASRERFDAILLDVWLPGIDGLETLEKLRASRVDTQVIMISGHGNIDTAVRATKLGAFDFVEKPLSLEKTLLVLRNALRQRMLENRTRRLMRLLSRDTEIHGVSPAADRLRARIDEAAGSDTPVLVMGPRGSGREAVVRRIHALSSRSEEAFVDIPCGALGAAAADAIFGSEDMPSRTSMGRMGTVLFEDLDQLDPELQIRLEAYLRSEQFQELGARPVATADPDGRGVGNALRDQIGVILVEVPPLRERREDVTVLADHYMTILAREYGLLRKNFSEDCRRAMNSWEWPGNVRELRNLVETLLLQVQGPEIRTSDLPKAMGGTELAPVDLYGEFGSLSEGAAAFEEYYIRRMVGQADGDLKKAARRLGLKLADLKARVG